jgi:hypothetical protein
MRPHLMLRLVNGVRTSLHAAGDLSLLWFQAKRTSY